MLCRCVGVSTANTFSQVMHLVRDPRDAMLSALALWRGQDGGLEFQSSEFCRRTMSKITSTDTLPEGQHMVVKLEQVGTAPLPRCIIAQSHAVCAG